MINNMKVNLTLRIGHVEKAYLSFFQVTCMKGRSARISIMASVSFPPPLTLYTGVTTYPNGYRHFGEWSQGKWNGKSTTYSCDGKMTNRVFNDGMPSTSTVVERPEDVYFGDGEPFRKY